MKKSLFAIALFILILYSSTSSVCFSIGASEAQMVLDLLENPGDFLFNLHSDNCDFTPVLKNRHGTIRTNFYPTTFPATWLNLSVKVKILSDGGFAPYVPQVDLVGEYGKMIAIDMAASSGDVESSSDSVKPGLGDIGYGILITKSVTEKTRIYGGLRFSDAALNVKFGEAMDLGGTTLSEINVGVKDTLIVTGIENQIGEKKYVVAHFSYSSNQKKIVSRIGWYSKHLELGFNIYPEGFMVMHPFMAWHWYF